MKIKNNILTVMLVATSMLASAQTKLSNPYGLVYEDAITGKCTG